MEKFDFFVLIVKYCIILLRKFFLKNEHYYQSKDEVSSANLYMLTLFTQYEKLIKCKIVILVKSMSEV